jgi:hypothetical protein
MTFGVARNLGFLLEYVLLNLVTIAISNFENG